MEEFWKDVKGYEGLYKVSNLGKVKSMPRNTKNQFAYQERILKVSNDKDGYCLVTLHDKSHKASRTHRVHRLVAMAFIENSDLKKTMINHIDGNKQNNCVNNLEWCTSQENIIHAYNNELIKVPRGKDNKNSKTVVLKKGHNEIVFYSETSASKFLNVRKTAISNCLKGRSRTCKGYKVQYEY